MLCFLYLYECTITCIKIGENISFRQILVTMGLFIYLWISLVTVRICKSQTSVIVFNVVEVDRLENITFVCDISSASKWSYISGPTGTAILRFQNEVCNLSPSNSFLTDKSKYSYTCNSTTHQVISLGYTTGAFNNHILTCRDLNHFDDTGSTWILKVLQDSCIYCEPTMTFYLREITEGDSITFVCSVSSEEGYVNWNIMNVETNTAAMKTYNGQCTTSPSPSFLDNTSEYKYTCNKTVYQVTVLKANRNEHNNMYMCTPLSMVEGKGTNWIIKIEAPVTSVTMAPTINEVDVKENTAVKFTCTTSTSRPAASVYWYIHPNGNNNDITQISENITTTTDYNDLSVTTSILQFVPARQHNNMNISCRANNSINTSPVMSNKQLLNVLYKADAAYIIQGSEYRVIENNPGALSCTVKGGNPTPTLSWSCNNFSPTNQAINTSNGNITTTATWTVLRNHDGTCTCTSQQTKFPEETFNVSLVVLHAASVTSFTANGDTRRNVTVNENETVSFICVADGNPTAVMILSEESEMLKTVTSNNITYNIDKASCLDAGPYVCSARNKYNGEANAQKELQLFVNCYPRAAGVINTNITGGLNNTKTIVFNVIAYPPPTFTWWQLVDETWTELGNDDNFNIQSSNIQSNLTIHRVGTEDFTRYKVIVVNDVNKTEQHYNLSPYDKPDPPTGFKHIDSRTTTSSIHLEWKPGSDNGPPQTFYIKYKRSSDTIWNYLNTPDNGKESMEFSLTELTENTQYEIVIFASNEKGNSTESSVLITTTKAIDKPNLIPLIGGIAGGVTGCIILVIVIIVLIRRYPVFKRSDADKQGVKRSVSVDLDNEDGSRADMQDVRRSSSVDTDNEDGLVDNPLYESSKPSAIYAKPLKPNKPNATGTGDVLYAEVKKTNKKEPKKKRQPPSGKGKQQEVDVYENVAPDNIPVKKGVTKHPHPEKPTTKESKIGNNKGLIYADLEFNDKQPGKKMVIKGDDSTTYDLVDFTKKAKPFPESDGDDEK